MTDEECQRRINRDFDVRTLKARVVIGLVFLIGGGSLVAYIVTTGGDKHVSSGAVRDE
jgi:hypothetical protein